MPPDLSPRGLWSGNDAGARVPHAGVVLSSSISFEAPFDRRGQYSPLKGLEGCSRRSESNFPVCDAVSGPLARQGVGRR